MTHEDDPASEGKRATQPNGSTQVEVSASGTMRSVTIPADRLPSSLLTSVVADDLRRSFSNSLISERVAADLRASIGKMITPTVSAMTADLQTSIAKLIAPNFSATVTDLQTSIAQLIAPEFRAAQASMIDPTALANLVGGDAFTRQFPSAFISARQPWLDEINRTMLASVAPALKQLGDAASASWLKSLASVDVDFTGLSRALKLRRVPPNWLDVHVDADAVAASIHDVLDDGIPLGWVPTGRVIDLLLNAPHSAGRRRVISNNWRGILSDCERVVGELPARGALFLGDMIRTSIRSLRHGYVEPSQALATNVLDTIVSQYSVPARKIDKGMLLNPNRTSDLSNHGWRFALSLRPISSVMTGRFTLEHRGTAFNRNATSHAITRRQYNRINAVIAIMLATSVLTCYVRDTPAFDEE